MIILTVNTFSQRIYEDHNSISATQENLNEFQIGLEIIWDSIENDKCLVKDSYPNHFPLLEIIK